MRIMNISMQSSATSMGASFNMSGVYIGHVVNCSIQLVFTGTPVGEFKLQGSNDAGSPNASQQPHLYDGVSNWSDITSSVQAVSAAGDVLYNLSNLGYNFIRVVYTRTSGTGSLTVARLNTKGV